MRKSIIILMSIMAVNFVMAQSLVSTNNDITINMSKYSKSEMALLELLTDEKRQELTVKYRENQQWLKGKEHLMYKKSYQDPEEYRRIKAEKAKADVEDRSGFITITVGSFSTCDYSSMQDAVNAAASGTTIRVTNETFTGDDAVFNVSNKSLVIRGGYDNCNSNAVITNDRTTLSGDGMSFADSVVEITDSSGSMFLYMYNIAILGGQIDGDGGGGIEISGKTNATIAQRINVYLLNMNILANFAVDGGGIHLTNADLLITDETIVHLNSAQNHGGGIYCEDSSIVLNKDSSIGITDGLIFPGYNTAAGNGGGVYLDDCELTLDATDGTTGAYVINNISNNQGGGVFATNDSIVNILGDKAWVNLNQAGFALGGGGGIEAREDSQINIFNGSINGNSANIGAGIDLNGGHLIMKRNDIYPCVGKCNELSENHARTHSSALNVQPFNGASTALLDGVWIEDNVTDGGGLMFTSNSLEIRNSMILNNTIGIRVLASLFDIRNNNTTIEYSTIAGNQAPNNPGFIFEVSSTDIEPDIHSNIIADNHTFFDMGLNFSFVALQETFANNIANIFATPPITDPVFLPFSNYHISPDSPAVDFGQATLDAFNDIDGEPRGQNEIPDAGADEANIRVGIAGGLCQYTTITEAIAASFDGDTTYISAGNYVENPGVISKSLTFVQAENTCQSEKANALNTDIIIDGSNNFTSSGGLFNIQSNNNVVFRNITMQNARANNGGIIYTNVDSNLTLDNVIIKNGLAQQEGGGIRALGDVILINDSRIFSNSALESGGGISTAVTAELTLENQSTISDNDASDFGGGVYARGLVILRDSSRIFANSAESGGGIYLLTASLSMQDSSRIGDAGFGNSASSSGGGIYAALSAVNLFDDSEIIGNSAVLGGGVFSVASNIKLQGSNHVGEPGSAGNSASIQGGGIYLGLSSSLTMSDTSEVSFNTAIQGAGVFLRVNGSVNNIIGGEISNNTATGAGGGMYIIIDFANPNINLDGVDILSNQAPSGAGISYLSNDDASSFEISNSYITSNSASGSGGGIRVSGNQALTAFNIVDTSISQNMASMKGGGLAIENATKLTMSGTLFMSNTAGDGGGIYLENGADLTSSDSSVIRFNSATRGGGIYVDGSVSNSLAEINDTEIIGNSANFGAGIYLWGADGSLANLLMRDSLISLNNASAWGGAIYANWGFSIIERTQFASNTAFFGSALYGSDSIMIYKNDIFNANSGPELFSINTGSNIVITGSTLTTEATADVFTAADISTQLQVDNTILSGFSDTTPGFVNVNHTCVLDSTGDLGSSASPLFIDAANHDYHLQAGSPAIDQCISGTLVDFEGNDRPVGSGATPYDIGAYEYQAGASDLIFANGFE